MRKLARLVLVCLIKQLEGKASHAVEHCSFLSLALFIFSVKTVFQNFFSSFCTSLQQTFLARLHKFSSKKITVSKLFLLYIGTQFMSRFQSHSFSLSLILCHNSSLSYISDPNDCHTNERLISTSHSLSLSFLKFPLFIQSLSQEKQQLPSG